MKILLRRFQRSDAATIGRIYVDSQMVCYSLEDAVRDVKIYGETAIPDGTYKVIVTFSPHFQRNLPLLVDVPNYEGVRIHPGNTAADTEGCILPGTSFGQDIVYNSRAAFELLFSKIKNATDANDDIWITVE